MVPRENKNNSYAKFWMANKEYFIEKLNAKRFFKNILKLLKNGRRFGVTLRHYQVKTVKVQTRIYKT